jgi:predicted N-acetyltransferase YhbS
MASTIVSNETQLRVKKLDPSDLEKSCDICFSAFGRFNESVGLPSEFPPRDLVDVPRSLLEGGLDTDGCEVFGLYKDNELVGSNMVDCRDGIAAIGPITVDPSQQNSGGGRLLMEAVQEAAEKKQIKSVRLMQICSNMKSFSLYLDCGFDPAGVFNDYAGILPENLPCPQGFDFHPLDESYARPCSELHERITGTSRLQEIAGSLSNPYIKYVVIHDNKVVAYTTGTYIGGHSVALNEDAFKALIWKQSQEVREARVAGISAPPPSVHISHEYPRLCRWLVQNGFRLQRMITMMSYGPHQKPKDGYYTPSIGY